MVVIRLSDQISHSMQRMQKSTLLDEVTLENCLIKISRALLDADVPRVLVDNMERNIQKIINDLPPGCKDGNFMQQAVFNELCKMLDPGKPELVLQKNESRVVMFIGLHGSEKDTVFINYARYHRRLMGFKPALVSADTYTPGALDRLNNLGANARLPVFGSYAQLNPVKVAKKGIEFFRRLNHDLIIVDTNSHHKQYTSLFEEMRQIAETMKPDLVVLVMDSRIGQAASVHAQAFKQSFHAGTVILTHYRGNTKACGAISSVAAARCPIFLAETGDKSRMFEVFDVKKFVTILSCKKFPREPCKLEVMGSMDLLRRIRHCLMGLFYTFDSK